MSVCTNNAGFYKESIEQCTQAIDLDSNSSKAYYLRSVAYLKRQQIDEALADILASIKLNPNDKTLRSHHAVVKEE